MHKWWERLMTDEAYWVLFLAKAKRCVIRGGLGLLGFALFRDWIPTGIPGAGQYGLVLVAVAMGIPIGDATPPELTAMINKWRADGTLPPLPGGATKAPPT